MPGSTNFLQFNPTQSNQESDSTWSGDALRTGGIQLNNTLPSVMLNKLFYSLSTFVAAFANMLVNKGYSPTDTSESALTAVLANVLTNADTQPTNVEVAYAANAVFDRSKAQTFWMFLNGNLTAPTLINTAPGQYTSFMFYINVPGATVTWPSNVLNGGAIDSTSVGGNIYQQMFVTGADNVTRAIGPLLQTAS